MILKRDNITFLEGYFISKSGRLNKDTKKDVGFVI